MHTHSACRAAGPLTAQDMTALFNPVPFGEERQTPLQQVLTQSPQLWDRLRNIDMDKEASLLQVWCSCSQAAFAFAIMHKTSRTGGRIARLQWELLHSVIDAALRCTTLSQADNMHAYDSVPHTSNGTAHSHAAACRNGRQKRARARAKPAAPTQTVTPGMAVREL